jgi:hypothetical protein
MGQARQRPSEPAAQPHGAASNRSCHVDRGANGLPTDRRAFEDDHRAVKRRHPGNLGYVPVLATASEPLTPRSMMPHRNARASIPKSE